MNQKLSPDIVKKIKQIEITTRRLMNGSLVGDARSAIKGSGFEFDQIREYQVGDDIRFIDWSGSARMNKLLVRQYIQERDHTVIIALDVSASGFFSSGDVIRSDMMAQLACVLTLVADYGKDAVGVVLFSQEVELVIPPSKGRLHVHTLMEKIFNYKPSKKKTSLRSVFEYIATINIKDAMVIVISDFIDVHSFEKQLRAAASRHDLIAIRCLDRQEQQFIPCGFLTVEDTETGMSTMLDLRSHSGTFVTTFLRRRTEEQWRIFKKYGVDFMDIYLHEQFIGTIIRFFRRRMMY